MIYARPLPADRIDQGDVLDGCPVVAVERFDADDPEDVAYDGAIARVVVLTQTCDLENNKATHAVVAVARDAEELIDDGVLKAADVRGPVRAGRVWGWYFLPKDDALELPELLVDLRQLHTVRLDVLRDLAAAGRRSARVQPLYREHLNRHLAETYGRIGLPQPYATD